MQSVVLPTRHQQLIKIEVCDQCYGAIPEESVERHKEWHIQRDKMKS